MKEGYRFVDCDMHIMEPVDLFEKSRPSLQASRHLIAAADQFRKHRDAAAAALVLRRSAHQ